MEWIVPLVLLLAVGSWIYNAARESGFRDGKREGSRKGYGVGYARGRRSRQVHQASGCSLLFVAGMALLAAAAVAFASMR